MLKIWVHDTQTLSPSCHGFTVCEKSTKIFSVWKARSLNSLGVLTTASLTLLAVSPGPTLHLSDFCVWLSLRFQGTLGHGCHGLGPVTHLGSLGKKIKSKQLTANSVLSSDFNLTGPQAGVSLCVWRTGRCAHTYVYKCIYPHIHMHT